jgi:excisionase family DNA binding protein
MTVEQLPEIMDVSDIQKYLGIGRRQAYELANSGKFRVLRVGRRIKIQRDTFIAWMKQGA